LPKVDSGFGVDGGVAVRACAASPRICSTLVMLIAVMTVAKELRSCPLVLPGCREIWGAIDFHVVHEVIRFSPGPVPLWSAPRV
jgi:hypothetical protein